jgi:hypothetical protein
MSGVNYGNQSVQKAELALLDRYVQTQSLAALGSPLTAIDTFPKIMASNTVSLTTANQYATYFVAPRDQAVTTVSLHCQVVDATITIKQVALCSVSADLNTLTILAYSANSTTAYTTGLNNVALTSFLTGTNVQLLGGQTYAVLFNCSATTMPQLAGINPPSSSQVFLGATGRIAASASKAAQYSSVGSTEASITTAASAIYFRLT